MGLRIRAIGDPAVRYVRDPVRMLRVLRHAARIGFDIDPGEGTTFWLELPGPNGESSVNSKEGV